MDFVCERGSTDCFPANMRGVNVHQQHPESGWTRLLYAARHGHMGCMRKLIDAARRTGTLDELIKAKNKMGHDALLIACNNDNADCAKLLLESGADPRVKGGPHGMLKDYVSPLMISCFKSEECLKLLIQWGADVNESDSRLMTPLFLACCHGTLGSVRALVAAGAKVDVRMIFHGCHVADPKLLRALLHRPFNVECKFGNDERTPLMVAADKGDEECIRVLIEAGANPNTESKSGRTALGIALSSGKKAVVEQLIRNGATPPRVGVLKAMEPRTLVDALRVLPSLDPDGAYELLASVDASNPRRAEILMLTSGLLYSHMHETQGAEEFKETNELMHMHVRKTDAMWAHKLYHSHHKSEPRIKRERNA